MKTIDIALKYGLTEYELNEYIKKNATFPVKETLWSGMIIPDDIDIKAFIRPLLEEKEQRNRKVLEKQFQLQQENQQRKLEEQKDKQFDLDKTEKLRLHAEDLARQANEELYHLRIDNLKAKQVDGYYEYKVISLLDIDNMFSSNSGRVNIAAMSQTLNELGIDGWRLVSAYSNECHKDVIAGFSNMDEHILIFERLVKL